MHQQPPENLKKSFSSGNDRKLETVEFNFAEAAKKIKDNRKIIFKIVLFFLILGLIVAFGSKTEYEGSCILVPEKKEGALSNLGGLSGSVGLTGINLYFGSQSTLSPEMYPQIVESLPFQWKLINKKISFANKDSLSSYTYFKEHYSPSFIGYVGEYTIGLPGKIKKIFSDDDDEMVEGENLDVANLSKADMRLIEKFTKRITVDTDPETGEIVVEAEMPDPVAAAKLTQETVDLLLQKITTHKLKKANKNLKFIRDKFSEARKKFEQAQLDLKNGSADAPVEKKKLQDEYELAFDNYKNLTTQLNQAEIKVEDETPVFTIVEPVTIPIEKSQPKRTLILALSLFLGLLIGGVVALFK